MNRSGGRRSGTGSTEPDFESASDGPVPLRWRTALAALRALPQGALSRAFGRVADITVPPRLRPLVIGAFARAVGADLAEAEKPVASYPSLNAFFVRRLRRGVRSWPSAADVAGSPVDGILGRLGRVESGRLMQAKGRDYSAAELLGDAAEAEAFDGGSFLTLYLSPRHYHRIHAPISGRIPRARHVPGALLPVNVAAVASIRELFVRNERLVCYIDAAGARWAVVAIGAYNVGRISADFDAGGSGSPSPEEWVTNRRGARTAVREYDPPLRIERGSDLMAFHLGSTVVLLVTPGMTLEPALRPGAEIRLGEPIARP